MQRLEQWVRAHGAAIAKTAVREFPGYGFGLCATCPIAADETILTIPYAIHLNRITLAPHFAPALRAFLASFEAMDRNVAVYVYLALNKTNPACFHAPYIGRRARD